MIFLLKKSLTMQKKTEGRHFGVFNIHSVAKFQKKLKGDTLGINVLKKRPPMPKQIQRWDPLVSTGIVCYTEEREKPSWFSSLGQPVHFGDTLKFFRNFGRTILVTSGVSKKNTDEKP